MTPRLPVVHGMTYLAAVTVKRGCIQALACTPSLAAAVGAAACVAAHGPSVATAPRGTCTRTLACGASVTVCNLFGWAKAHPYEGRTWQKINRIQIQNQ